MKPVGLADPRTGRRPFAVVQLRQDNLAASHFSLVGFQTQLKWGEQKRIFRMIPGLENAEFVRFGMIHRNTYVNSPTPPRRRPSRPGSRPGLFFAGQMSGVEGYVESAASGLLAGHRARPPARAARSPQAFPVETALGALGRYISGSDPEALPAHQHRLRPAARAAAARSRTRRRRRLALAERALESLGARSAAGARRPGSAPAPPAGRRRPRP